MKPTQPQRILFVCLGNIVRSPLAENLFRHKVAQAGLDDWYTADSAGTAAYHIGEPPDERMRQVAAGRGLNYSGAGRQFGAADFEEFDLILAMDATNQADILRLAMGEAQRAKVRLMRSYDSVSQPGDPVPDPYYGGLAGFEEVYDILDRATDELLRQLEAERAESG